MSCVFFAVLVEYHLYRWDRLKLIAIAYDFNTLVTLYLTLFNVNVIRGISYSRHNLSFLSFVRIVTDTPCTDTPFSGLAVFDFRPL